jgi:hypothetical protein
VWPPMRVTDARTVSTASISSLPLIQLPMRRLAQCRYCAKRSDEWSSRKPLRVKCEKHDRCVAITRIKLITAV